MVVNITIIHFHYQVVTILGSNVHFKVVTFTIQFLQCTTSVLQACYKLVTKVVFFTVLWQGCADLQCLEQPCCNFVCHSKVVNQVVPCTNFLLISLIVLAGPI